MEKIMEKLNTLELPEELKEGVIGALETMSSGNRFYIIKTEEFKEYSVLINDNIVVKTKKYNYDGEVAMRKENIVDLEDYIEYLETRANEIDETQERIKTM